MTPAHALATPSSFPRTANWYGRSGRGYGLITENLDRFSLRDSELYLIAKGSLVLWVGSAGELVNDPLSRSRFRLALTCADRVYRLVASGTDLERASVIWDLEGAAPETSRNAA